MTEAYGDEINSAVAGAEAADSSLGSSGGGVYEDDYMAGTASITAGEESASFVCVSREDTYTPSYDVRYSAAALAV